MREVGVSTWELNMQVLYSLQPIGLLLGPRAFSRGVRYRTRCVTDRTCTSEEHTSLLYPRPNNIAISTIH
jgi:hypothetical protein